MTEAEFTTKYRPRLLLFLTEAWAIRKEPPTELGQCIDLHAAQLKQLMREMYADLTPPLKTEAPKPEARNGVAPTARK